MSSAFDAVVIGSGQAGPFLGARLAAAGMKVALIEREHLGGTCVNDGCMPTKTLVASARAAYIARNAARYGVTLGGEVSVDMKAVKARKDRVVSQSVQSLTSWLSGLPNLTLIRGHARFIGSHAVMAGSQILEAPRIFINVGALPEHLVVVGGSYIGLEFAQIYRRFGSKVTVLEYADRLIAREDPEVCSEVQHILEREGVQIHLNVRGAGVSVSKADGRIQVALHSGGTPLLIEGSHLLAAVGRQPNTDDLGLNRAGIATDGRGFIKVDAQLRTNVPGVWALGDVNARGSFTHTSYNDHEIVAANLLDGESRRIDDRIPAYALFIDPPLGRIGMTEAEVRSSGRPALVGVMPMTRVGRARERGETQGFMKVLVDAQSERILGASLLCIEGDEIVHSLLDLMYSGASYKVIQRAVHIHPTVTELIPTLLGNLTPLGEPA